MYDKIGVSDKFYLSNKLLGLIKPQTHVIKLLFYNE